MDAGMSTFSFFLTLILTAPLFAQAMPQDGYAELPGVRIHYADSGGNGTVVVLLHAATGSIPMWENQFRAFGSAGYRVIAYERRGWGKTIADPSAPQGTAADDLVALMDHLKVSRFHLLGIAGGGFTAIDFALSFPQRLRSLVIASTIGGIVDEDYQKLGQWMRPPSFDGLSPELKELGPTYRAANRTGAERWIELERASRPAGPRAAAQPLKNRLTLAALETLNLPTLAIAGGADLYAPPGVMQAFVSRIRNAKSVTIPDSGHSPNWENPETFNRTVLEFLRRVK